MTTSPIQVAYGIDTHWVQPALVSIYSLLRNTDHDVHITVFGYRLSDADVSQFADLEAHSGQPIVVRDYSPAEFAGYSNTRYPVPSLVPLSLPKLLEGRCIFLDADTLIVGDIQELSTSPLDGNFLGACIDFQYIAMLNRLFSFRLSELFRPAHSAARKTELITRLVTTGLLPGQPYFNSGVMLMDCEGIRRNADCARSLDGTSIAQFSSLYPDQDCLNAAFKERWTSLPLHWNVSPIAIRAIRQTMRGPCADLHGAYRHEAVRALNAPRIWHYIGPRKPWLSPRRRMTAIRQRAYADWWRNAEDLSQAIELKAWPVRGAWPAP